MKGEWFASYRYTFRNRETKEETDVTIEVIEAFKRQRRIVSRLCEHECTLDYCLCMSGQALS